jgi:predicted alpha/beta-fold hydrolase
MWESLATDRRQDRALHGLAKAVGLLIGVVLAPIWIVGQRLRNPLKRALERGAVPPRLPVAEPGERSMAALMSDLEAIPCRLRHDPRGDLRMVLADAGSFVLAQQRAGIGLGYAYPSQFNDHVFEGADGERISASIALHDRPRPGLIVVHGVFSTRHFDYVRKIAVRAYYEWGFNVAAVDLRSFGLTELTSDAPTTLGWKEGEDLIACGLYLKELGATSVGALGISLGGSSVLGACHPEGAEDALDGGVLASCPPADPRRVAERLNRKALEGRPDAPGFLGFRAMLTSRIHSARWPAEVKNFLDPMEQLAEPYYGVPADELWERAAAIGHIADARVPVLVIHAEDDWLIPVSEARTLAEVSRGNDLVRVWILPGGGHGAFDGVDPRWAFTVYRRFFERWADYGPAGDAGLLPPAEQATEPVSAAST